MNNVSGLHDEGAVAFFEASKLLAMRRSEPILLQEITHPVVHFTHMASQSLASFEDLATHLTNIGAYHVGLLDHLVQASLPLLRSEQSPLRVGRVISMDLLAVFSLRLVVSPAFFLLGFKFRNLKFP